MNKAKFAAISMGIFASCLFGGYAVADAATVTLDESATGTPQQSESLSAEYKAYQAAAESPVETVSNYVSAQKQKKNTNVIIGKTVRIDNTSYNEIPEAPAKLDASAPVEDNVQTQETSPETTETQEVPETTQQSTAVTARVFVKSTVSTKTAPETTAVQETQAVTEAQTEETSELPASETEQPETTVEETTTEETTPETKPAETVQPETTTTAPKSFTVKVTRPAVKGVSSASGRELTTTSAAPETTASTTSTSATTTTTTTTTSTTTSTTTTTTTTSTSTTTTTTTTTPEPVLTTAKTTTTTIPEPEIVDASDFTLDELLPENYEEYAEVPQIEEFEEAEETPAPAISNRDYILLCNCVAHEAGSDVISIENKAKVVEVVMNRVASSEFPNTIYGVITQRAQFSGSSSYADSTTYTRKVTDNVKAAVDLYFADPSAFNHGYKYFYGDGSQNHFRVS